MEEIKVTIRNNGAFDYRTHQASAFLETKAF